MAQSVGTVHGNADVRPRKQRTRQHVIADQSVNHVERLVIDAGHAAQRLTPDYGYDLVLFTYDEQGYLEPGSVYLQLKAGETLEAVGPDYVFDLDVRDYNLWMLEEMPVLLISIHRFADGRIGSVSKNISARMRLAGLRRARIACACACRSDNPLREGPSPRGAIYKAGRDRTKGGES